MKENSNPILTPLPKSLEVEASILGAMLIDSEAIPIVFEALKPEHFYNPSNKLICSSIISLWTRNEPVDSISVCEELSKTGKLEEVGGIVYINKLATEISTSANIEYHSKIIIEKWMARQIIKTSMNISKLAHEGKEDISDIINKALTNLYSVSNIFERKRGAEISSIGQKVIESIESIKKGDISNFALKSGFTDLDKKIIGFRKSELTIIAARPGMGKTAFLLSLVKSLSHEKWGAIFSLEMNDESLYTRLLSGNTGIEFNDLIGGNFNKEQGVSISRSIHQLNNLKLFIDDTPSLSVIEFQSKAKRLKNEYDIGWIGLDYLQLMKAKAGNREQEISQISQSLKATAKELNIPIIALSQLNRGLELRNDKTPQLADLRESGAIEQDADLVLFIYRPELYGLDFITDHNGDSIKTGNLALVTIGKQRNGVLGTIKLTFINKIMKFENYRKDIFMLNSNLSTKSNMELRRSN